MSYEQPLGQLTFEANADLSSHKGCGVTLLSGKAALASTAGQDIIGLLGNKPELGQQAVVITSGVAMGLCGGTVTALDRLQIEVTTGRVITAENDGVSIGIALAGSTDGGYIPVLLDSRLCGATGAHVADVADDNVIGGIPVIHRIETAGGASANYDVTLTHKTRVIDAWCVLKGAGSASDTIAIQNVTTALTDSMDVSGSDKAIVRAGTIDDAQHEIAAGANLRVAETDGAGSDSPAADVYVLGIRVA